MASSHLFPSITPEFHPFSLLFVTPLIFISQFILLPMLFYHILFLLVRCSSFSKPLSCSGTSSRSLVQEGESKLAVSSPGTPHLDPMLCQEDSSLSFVQLYIFLNSHKPCHKLYLGFLPSTLPTRLLHQIFEYWL